MSELEAIKLAVMAYAGYATWQVAKAPVEGAAEVIREHSAGFLRERVNRRLDRIIDNATTKNDGVVPTPSDRIAFKTLTEGAFTDDELMADYLGGVLASSDTEDDSGAAVIAQIGRLSAIQLRLHYVIYREVRRLAPDPPPNLYEANKARHAGIRLPIVDLEAAGVAPLSLSSSIAALRREGLVGEGAWSVGVEPTESFASIAVTMRVLPSAAGAELFLWGHGSRRVHASRLFDTAELNVLTNVPATPCATLQSQDVLALLSEVQHDHGRYSLVGSKDRPDGADEGRTQNSRQEEC